jgi:hypothetical protein
MDESQGSEHGVVVHLRNICVFSIFRSSFVLFFSTFLLINMERQSFIGEADLTDS